jgi:hypothetical protein
VGAPQAEHQPQVGLRPHHVVVRPQPDQTADVQPTPPPLPAAPQSATSSAAAAAAGGSGSAAHALAMLLEQAPAMVPPALTTILLIVYATLAWRVRQAAPSRAPPVF